MVCCVVLWCGMGSRGVVWCVMLRFGVGCWCVVVLCCVWGVMWCDGLCCVVLWCGMVSCGVVSCIMLRFGVGVLLCCVVLCCAVLCCVRPVYGVSFSAEHRTYGPID